MPVRAIAAVYAEVQPCSVQETRLYILQQL
jgi:hypothetical protein